MSKPRPRRFRPGRRPHAVPASVVTVPVRWRLPDDVVGAVGDEHFAGAVAGDAYRVVETGGRACPIGVSGPPRAPARRLRPGNPVAPGLTARAVAPVTPPNHRCRRESPSCRRRPTVRTNPRCPRHCRRHLPQRRRHPRQRRVTRGRARVTAAAAGLTAAAAGLTATDAAVTATGADVADVQVRSVAAQ